MEELDLLKKSWNEPAAFEQVSENEIYKMVHKKSSSIVRLILIISVLELLIFRGLDFFFIFFDTKDIAVLKQFGIYDFEIALTLINVFVLGVFIYFLYQNYIKIANDAATKQLMEDIIKTRKIVNCYVFYNFMMIIGSFFYIAYKMLFSFSKLDILENKDFVLQDQKAFLMIVFVVGVLILLVLVWLFYKLLYGILLKKLNQNYIELKKIDL